MFLLALAAPITAEAQRPSPNPPPTRPPWDGALELRFPVRETCPDLSTDMPLDVLIGYIAGDSLARTLPRDWAERFRDNGTYSDTLRYALKYRYLMDDYDPIRLFQWTGQTQHRSGRSGYGTHTETLQDVMTFRARVTYPDTQRTAVLCDAHIIARVRVTATRTKIDTNAGWAKHATLVTCTIIDPIKGKRIPNCGIDSDIKERDRGTANTIIPPARAEGGQLAVPGACLQFEAALEWPRNGGDSKPRYPSVQKIGGPSLADGFAGKPGPWVQPNTEYFVFLQFRGLGGDSALNASGQLTDYHFATLFPIAWFGYTCCLYPVVDGTVYDPRNDFGFGANLTPAQFAAALRSRISSIINL